MRKVPADRGDRRRFAGGGGSAGRRGDERGATSCRPPSRQASSRRWSSWSKQAGLAGTLEGKGPFTVFAPTDAAFAKVPKATLAALEHDRAKLRAVLLYHVAKGKLTAAKVVKLRSVKTLNGQSLKVRVSHGNVTIGGARVIKTDIGASNGVIHVIDKVLIPR